MSSQETTARAAAAPAPLVAVPLDAVNLEQALRDFELANRRVVDLTQRLLDVTDEARSLRSELESLRIAHNRLLATNHEAHVALQQVQGSRAFALVRVARRIVGR